MPLIKNFDEKPDQAGEAITNLMSDRLILINAITSKLS